MKEKLTKDGVGFLCILGMTSPIKFDTIFELLMVIETLTIKLLAKSMKYIIVSCCYKPPDGNWKNHCDHCRNF